MKFGHIPGAPREGAGGTGGAEPQKQTPREEYAALIVNGLPIIFDKVNVVTERYVATNKIQQPTLAGVLPIVIPDVRTLTLSIKIPTDKVGRAYFRGVKEILRLMQFLLAQHKNYKRPVLTTENGDNSGTQRMIYAERMELYKRSLQERSEAVNLMTGHPAYPQAIQELQQLRAGEAGGANNAGGTPEGKKEEGIQRPPQYALCTYLGIFTNITFCMIKEFKSGGRPEASDEETWDIVLEEFNMGQYTEEDFGSMSEMVTSKDATQT